ncbi:hypothetical protein BJF78_23775 [Pseudonocardia sp. CNS-139]|nr:hypothetical protein BJF78_23775 [Pseudonocardia sp. CNS-139]
MVSTLRRDPAVKWVMFDCACAATGVVTALRTAGIDGVTIGGEAPLTTQIQEMKGGSPQAWAALSLPILGFGLIDALARHFNGDSMQPVLDQRFPWQIVTNDNVHSVVLDGADNYVGLASYGDAFSGLWHVGRD